MKPIVVTGAAGKTGSVVVRELLRARVPVRALVRRIDGRSAALAAAGADVVVADLHDYTGLVPALRGASAAYFIPPWGLFGLDAAAAFAAAAIDAELPAIVELSQWLSSPVHPSLYTRQHWLITRLFAALPGIVHVTVNPGFFADNLLITDLLRNAVHLGIYPYPMPREMRNAPPSSEDIGRVAAAVLQDPAAHRGRSYRPTGPALIDGDDVVATLSRVFGRRMTLMHPPLALQLRAIKATGMTDAQVIDSVEYFRESSAWAVDAPNDVVRRLTGREPEDFETIARRSALHPALQPTFGNRVRTLWDFGRLAFIPARTPAQYRRDVAIPQPAGVRLSSESAAWLHAHRPSLHVGDAVERQAVAR